MKIDPKESFIRWQTVTREHFTFTSNVVLGLATGLLAFVSERFLSGLQPSCVLLVSGILSLLLLIASIGIALWCSVNRLKDFRATAQIARDRDKNNSNSSSERLETKALGELSWKLFRLQVILFGLGVLASVLTLLIRGWS